MSLPNQNDVRLEQLRFFGKITASVTHEINNVFSIIGENSGLLSDRLKRAESGDSLDLERVKKICDTIQKHLERGKAIVKRLNTFAHAADEEVKDIELDSVIQNMVLLCGRFAYRKRIELETVLPENPVNVTVSQFLVQEALFNAIMFVLERSESIEKISVELAEEGDKARIIVRGQQWEEDPGMEGELKSLARIADELKAEVALFPEKGVVEISLPGAGRSG